MDVAIIEAKKLYINKKNKIDIKIIKSEIRLIKENTIDKENKLASPLIFLINSEEFLLQK